MSTITKSYRHSRKTGHKSDFGKPQASLTVTADKPPVLKPVSFGGDLTLALGLAESIKLLNEYQVNAAAHGVDWLAEQQEGE